MISHDKIFKKVIYLVTIITLYILLIAIIVGMFNVFRNIGYAWLEKGGFGQIVYSILTIFVLIDFFKAFADYRIHERIKLTYVTDATILIVMREIATFIYSQKFENELLLVFSVMLLVLGIIRVIAVKYPPAENLDPFSTEEETES